MIPRSPSCRSSGLTSETDFAFPPPVDVVVDGPIHEMVAVCLQENRWTDAAACTSGFRSASNRFVSESSAGEVDHRDADHGF